MIMLKLLQYIIITTSLNRKVSYRLDKYTVILSLIKDDFSNTKSSYFPFLKLQYYLIILMLMIENLGFFSKTTVIIQFDPSI